MDIGEPQRVIQVEPLPVPHELPAPEPEPDREAVPQPAAPGVG